MAFSAIYDLVIDERDVRTTRTAPATPVLMLPDSGSSAGDLGMPHRPRSGPATASWSRSTCRARSQRPGAGSRPRRHYVDHVRRVVEQLGPEPVDVVGLRLRRLPGRRRRRDSDPQLDPATWCSSTRMLPPRSGPSGEQPDVARRWRSVAPSPRCAAAGSSRTSAGFAAGQGRCSRSTGRGRPAAGGAAGPIRRRTLIVGAAEADAGDRARLDLLADAIPGATGRTWPARAAATRAIPTASPT